MGDAMGEARVASLVGHAGKVVVVGESGAPASGGGVAHRGHLLECDADAAARGVSDGLLVHISEAIFNQAVSEEQSGYGERAGVSMGADTRANTASGGGAPQVGDLRLLEDGGERGGALVSGLVIYETASKGWDGDGGRE